MENNKIDKRGIAPVVSATLLILLTVFIAGVVTVVVTKTVDVQSSPEFSCLDIKLENVGDLRRACFNPDANEIEVGVSLGNEEFLVEGLNFIFDLGNGESSSWKCTVENGCTVLGPGEFANYHFSALEFDDIEEINEVAFYINNCEIGKMDVGVC